MNISRGFIVMGAVYLVVGIVFGAYMGGSGDHSLAPVHAHINLLGFTLMTVFGIGYRLIPGLAEGTLPQAALLAASDRGVACFCSGFS